MDNAHKGSKKDRFLLIFETFGRSFLLPVSVLPAAGILKGIGYNRRKNNPRKVY